HDVATRKLPAGRFEVRGELPPGELVLRVTHREHAAPPRLPFERGQPDLRVTLTRGGSMDIAVLVDEGVTQRELRLFLPTVAGAGEAKQAPAQARRPEASGRLAAVWRGLAAGTYDLVARTVLDAAVVKTVPGIAIAPGKACDDPRVVELDLRGLLRRIEITAVDGDGEAIKKPGTVAVTGGQSVPLQAGKAKLWIGGASVDVTL